MLIDQRRADDIKQQARGGAEHPEHESGRGVIRGVKAFRLPVLWRNADFALQLSDALL